MSRTIDYSNYKSQRLCMIENVQAKRVARANTADTLLEHIRANVSNENLTDESFREHVKGLFHEHPAVNLHEFRDAEGLYAGTCLDCGYGPKARQHNPASRALQERQDELVAEHAVMEGIRWLWNDADAIEATALEAEIAEGASKSSTKV